MSVVMRSAGLLLLLLLLLGGFVITWYTTTVSHAPSSIVPIATSTNATTTPAISPSKTQPVAKPTPAPIPPPPSTPPSPLPDSGARIALKEGQRADSLLVETIAAGRVVGTNFVEYPIARDGGLAVVLSIGDTVSNGCTVRLTLTAISDDTAFFIRDENPDALCPICLSEGTRIDTPNGSVAVEEVTNGMEVWAPNEDGTVSIARVIAHGSTVAPATHTMVVLTLADGREVAVSPLHPLFSGTTAGEVRVGDLVDNSLVVRVTRHPYANGRTYDIRTDAPSGGYIANGIPMLSTLSK